ncbi:MAG TPA: tripartite tricarboxylate transporter substrate binding protein [Burkholderiales bacterium]|nr:tripartite tricarboxylate transporter substrate binding protein [Burkholderiales bacterium]
MLKTLATTLALALAAAVHAQEPFPSRPITIVVPNPPGGMNQITAQPLAIVMEKLLKQPVVVSNKPGGTGAVGAAFIANQKPDGYNLLVTTPNLFLVIEKNKLFGEEAPYKLEQIAPLALTSADPLILVVQASNPAKSVADFVAAARAKQGEMAYSSSGPYGITHVPMEMFLHAAGLKLRHVPTTGGGPAITQLLGGHVDIHDGGLAAVLPHLKSGKFRALANYGAKRSPRLADVPTMKELGYDIEAYLWVGLFTTAGVPDPVFKALRESIRTAIADPQFQTAMTNSGVDVDYRDAPEFKQFFDADHKRLAAAVKAIGRVDEKK